MLKGAYMMAFPVNLKKGQIGNVYHSYCFAFLRWLCFKYGQKE